MKLSLRSKIFILIALPCAGLVTLLFMFITTNYQEYVETAKAVEYVKYSTNVSKLIHEIQKERGVAALYINGKLSSQELIAQRGLVDQGGQDLVATLPNTPIKDQLSNFNNEYQRSLAAARSVVDAKGVPAEATKSFSESIGKLILSEIMVAQNAKASGDEKRLLSVAMLDIGKENTGKLRANVGNALSANAPLTIQQVNLIASLRAGLNENLSSPTLIISDETKFSLEAFKETSEWKKAQETIGFVLDNSDKGKFNRDSKEFVDTITAAINNLGKIVFKEQELVSNSINKNKTAITKSLTTMIILSFLLLTAVVVLSIYFIRSITKPIQILMEKLSISSEDVNVSSGSVSEASEQLSQNSTEQAAALQEAVASVEEITQMISKTASNAKESQDVSKISAETAQGGQRIVEELSGSISEIAMSNEKIKERILQSNVELSEISKIISEIGNKTNIINDIVFQTKLLSFNASVEAARAGEQGKGFAVVAEEVGNLAVMSGNAAKEITEVLEKSLNLVDKTIENTKREIATVMEQSKQSIDRGAKTAKKCGESLSEIVGKVQEVNQLVVEIAVASEQQSQGMSQISLAMNELDSATHANSASAIESAKFGQLLKQQSHGLELAIKELSTVVYGGGEVPAVEDDTNNRRPPTKPDMKRQTMATAPKKAASAAISKVAKVASAAAAPIRKKELTPAHNDSRFEDV